MWCWAIFLLRASQMQAFFVGTGGNRWPADVNYTPPCKVSWSLWVRFGNIWNGFSIVVGAFKFYFYDGFWLVANHLLTFKRQKSEPWNIFCSIEYCWVPVQYRWYGWSGVTDPIYFFGVSAFSPLVPAQNARRRSVTCLMRSNSLSNDVETQNWNRRVNHLELATMFAFFLAGS